MLAQPFFVGTTRVSGSNATITLTPITGLAVGDWLVLLTANYCANVTAAQAPGVNAAWGAPVNAFFSTDAGGGTGSIGRIYFHKWTGSEASAFWDIVARLSQPCVAAVVAYRSCDAAYPQWCNVPANATSSGGGVGQMVTNPMFNPLSANAGMVVLFALCEYQGMTCTPPATSQTGAYTARVTNYSVGSTGQAVSVYIGDSPTTPVGTPNITLPNGNAWSNSISVSTAAMGVMLVPPTVTAVTQIAATGVQTASGLPSAISWTNPGNVTADDDARATLLTTARRDSNCLRATFAFAVPAAATVLGFSTESRLRAWTGTGSTSSGAWDLTWNFVDLATGLYDGNTTQSHVQNIPAPTSNQNPPDSSWFQGGGPGDIWGRTPAPTPADVNNALWGFNLIGSQMQSNVTVNSHLDVDSMYMSVFHWRGIDVGGPLLFCEA
jgi:hypothetical protein